ncbi:hypothetical protein [Acidithiobacillus acidisediminis]|uniref:hypothetical protein n=1 Tax=Acidithiobacillus acidisediminis TaxID=2937799 RepID=UPI00200F983B|nr:hypothetical protein [Acidithiobacillus sp. S30A2]
MKIRIIPRLRRDQIAERYRDAPQERSARVSHMLETLSMQDLTHMGLRRANREVPDPPYEPFAIWLSWEAAQKIAQLPEHTSVSAIVQNILRHDPDRPVH